MNYKSILCYLAISALATSLHADTANEQELREQLAIKQQELYELAEKIITQEQRIQEHDRNLNDLLKKCGDPKKTEMGESEYKELLGGLNSFCRDFWRNGKRDMLFDEFDKKSSSFALAEFYYLWTLYERVFLQDLVRQWEETAQEVNALLFQMGHWITK